MRCRLFGLVCLLLFWTAGSLAIRAQAPTAQISGTVVDPAGHILPGVLVTLESVAGAPPTIDAPATSVVASTTVPILAQSVIRGDDPAVCRCRSRHRYALDSFLAGASGVDT